MAIELAQAYVSIIPSARGIEKNLATELAPVSAAAAAEGTKAGKSLGANISSGLNSSIKQLSGVAAGFGVPFAAQLSTINSRLDLSTQKTAGFASALSNIGRTELLAAGIGLVVLGTSAVHAADQFEISHARLVSAVQNTGQEFSAASSGVGTLDDSFVKLGFNTSDTENALSRLTSATGNVAKATQLMGLAADIARARNIPLVQSADLLSKASLGTFTQLRRLGIASKDDIAGFKNLGDVTAFLTAKFGGQGAAFADTFAGKMAALKAQANQLEVTLGTALIPKIESLAQVTISGVQGIESFNRETGGAAGKVALIAAAVPAAVFALGKLVDVLKAVAASEGLAATGGTLLAGALIGAVGGIALGDKINESFGGAKPNVDALAKSFQNLAQSHVEDSVAVTALGGNFSKLAGDLNTIQGSTLQKGFGFAPSAHAAVKDISATNDALKQLITTAGPTQAYKAFGQLASALEKAGVSSTVIGKEFGPFIDALDQARVAGKGAAESVSAGASAADQAGFAWLGLGKSVNSAASALSAIQSKDLGPTRSVIAADSAQTNVQSALDALNNPDIGSSGGGGSGQTATAAALDAIQKNLTLRDSELGISQAAQGVKDAQEQLAQAHKDEATAAKAVADAQQNLRNVLQGVSRDSQAAKDATLALTQAQNDATGANLSVDDAKRALAQAKVDAGGAQFAVTDANITLQNDIADQADPEQIAKDTIALKDARIQASGATDSVKKAELDLSNAQLDAKQKTKDLNTAQKDLNGTLHGFPPTSQQAKDAQDQLTQAQQQAKTASDAERQAQDGLTTAVNQTADANLALLRAQADLDGKLTASTGATSAGKKLDSLQTRIDNAKGAILDLADAAAKADLATGHSFGDSILQEIGVLQTYAAANPLLANAFNSALQQLETQFALYLANKQGHPGTTGSNQTSAQRKALGFADGGVVPGPLGAPVAAIVHGGETIVPPMSLANSRPMPFGGSAAVVNVYALDPRTASQLVVKALEEHNGGYLPRTIKTTS